MVRHYTHNGNLPLRTAVSLTNRRTRKGQAIAPIMHRRKRCRRIRQCSSHRRCKSPSQCSRMLVLPHPAFIQNFFMATSTQKLQAKCNHQQKRPRSIRECLGSDGRQNLHKHIYSALRCCSPLEHGAF